jgi:hypothetical protein
MANRRGRPSKDEQNHALSAAEIKIGEQFRRLPLRQPVEQTFKPYLERISAGEIRAIFEYNLYGGSPQRHGSFFELVGRLLFMQSVPGVDKILSQLVRKRDQLLDLVPPDYLVFRSFYPGVKSQCDHARKFLREKYKEYCSSSPEELWHEYWHKSLARKVPERSRISATTKEDPEATQLNQDSDAAMNKAMFLALAEAHCRRSVPPDLRYRYRRFRRTPASVAREFTCKMIGISVSEISHLKLSVGD